MALVLLLLAGSPPVQAQGSGATDNELYAAYCKGAMNGLDQAAPQVQQMSQRFSGYLFTTGAMTDPRRRDAVLGIGAAMTRGRAGFATACLHRTQSVLPPRDALLF
jgi:hypothetical protein